MRSVSFQYFARLRCLASTIGVCPMGIRAQDSKPALPAAPSGSASSTSKQPQEMTASDVGAFLDGVVSMQLQSEDIAGAVVVIVRNGGILFAKGYGYADVKARVPVSPASTLFRPGSISKTFTWTAVMQLVEQGKIKLDADINDYLDFQIPHNLGRPVTMRNLMTHTPGFEEVIKDLMADKVDESPSLRALPHRKRAGPQECGFA